MDVLYLLGFNEERWEKEEDGSGDLGSSMSGLDSQLPYLLALIQSWRKPISLCKSQFLDL